MKQFKSFWRIFRNDRLLQKIVKNAGYLLSSNVFGMGLSVVQSILAGRLLGVAGFGIIGTIIAFASTLNRFFSFRMNELVVKYFGESLAKGKNEEAASVIKASGLGEIGSAVLSFAILLAAAPFAAEHLADDPSTANLSPCMEQLSWRISLPRHLPESCRFETSSANRQHSTSSAVSLLPG